MKSYIQMQTPNQGVISYRDAENIYSKYVKVVDAQVPTKAIIAIFYHWQVQSRHNVRVNQQNFDIISWLSEYKSER